MAALKTVFLQFSNVSFHKVDLKGAGIACWWSPGLVIKRLWVRIPAAAARFLFSPELTLCADSHLVSIPPPVLLQWHVKDPGHSAKSAGGRLHLNTHTLLTQRSQSGLTMPVTRHSIGIYQKMSLHATHQETLGHRHLSSLSHCGLILA